MKLSLSEIIDINNALTECGLALKEMQTSKDQDYDSKVSYTFAKNINIIKGDVSEFMTENEIRVQSFSEKDEKGEILIVNNKIIFGKNKLESDKIYKELCVKEKDINFLKIGRNNCTDKLPVLSMAVLLDIIITE